MTQTQALALADSLTALGELRKNKFFLLHYLHEVRRIRDENEGPRDDKTLPAPVRCEHGTAYGIAQHFLEFCDQEEKRLRALLTEFDKSTPIIERPFGV